MSIRSSLMVLSCLTFPAHALQPKGISIAHEQQARLDAQLVNPHSFNLADLFRGGGLPRGLGGWAKIVEKLSTAGRSESKGLEKDLNQAMENSNAYVDPALQQGLLSKLRNNTVQDRLRNLSQNPELLIKTVQENPRIQQLMSLNPAIAKLIKSPGALQKIFSPEMIREVQSGHPSVDSIQGVFGSSNASTASNLSRPQGALPEGLTLKEVKAGDGKKYPQDGDEVTLKYKGYLKDRSMFDSGSFSFHIGSDEAIQGWDIAVRHMSLGERAVLQVPARLAYGSAGNGPIPPDADLVFDMSLREINQ